MTDYQKRYFKEKRVTITLNFYKSTDADIIQFLNDEKEKGNSKLGTVKKAIRAYMESEKR